MTQNVINNCIDYANFSDILRNILKLLHVHVARVWEAKQFLIAHDTEKIIIMLETCKVKPMMLYIEIDKASLFDTQRCG